MRSTKIVDKLFNLERGGRTAPNAVDIGKGWQLEYEYTVGFLCKVIGLYLLTCS
jgi:hypothetical protein